MFRVIIYIECIEFISDVINHFVLNTLIGAHDPLVETWVSRKLAQEKTKAKAKNRNNAECMMIKFVLSSDQFFFVTIMWRPIEYWVFINMWYLSGTASAI